MAGDGQFAPVHTAVAVPPSVLVATETGEPMPGVVVTFQVGAGGGSASGRDAITNAAGIATVGRWVLGDRTGTNTLNAIVAGSAAAAFTATGLVGFPASIAKSGGDGQLGAVWMAVDTAPAVRVTDVNGNPLPGVPVAITVTSGGGSVSAPSVTTDYTGTARPGTRVLGPARGTNTLSAVAEGLPPVTFTAVAVDYCDPVPYALGSSVLHTLTPSSSAMC